MSECVLLPDGADQLDAVADALAGVAAPEVAEHVAGCPSCGQLIADLQRASPYVAASLAAAPAPVEPPGLQARLTEALATERQGSNAALAGPPPLAAATAPPTPHGSVTVLPPARTQRRGWLPWAGGVAAAAVLVTGGLLLTHGSGTGSSSTATSASGSSSPELVRNDTGTDYARDGKALVAAVPGLLAGAGRSARQPAAGVASSPGAVGRPTPAGSDPLAGLRTTEGLASCLASLTSPDVPGDPLAVDYARYAGRPALVVLLPSTAPGKVDVFVVGAGCSQRDATLLYFTRAARR